MQPRCNASVALSHACAAVLSSIAHPDLPTAYWQVLLRLAPAHVKVPWVSLKPRVRDVVRCVSLAATADARTAVSLPMVVAGWARIGWQVHTATEYWGVPAGGRQSAKTGTGRSH